MKNIKRVATVLFTMSIITILGIVFREIWTQDYSCVRKVFISALIIAALSLAIVWIEDIDKKNKAE